MTIERLPDTRIFDAPTRLARVDRLRASLGLTTLSLMPSSEGSAELPSVGIEIEMTWRQAFQDMHTRWLNAPDSPRDYDMDSDIYREFAETYERNDARLLPILRSITPVVPRVGCDAYWEFSFYPTKDPVVTDAELSTLYDAGLLFKDIPYATHMTLANIPTDRDAATILCLLEQADGTTPQRIEAARTSHKGSWAQKGTGGFRKRHTYELKGNDTTAYEFRTLITTSPEQIGRLIRLGQELAHTCLYHPTAWQTMRSGVEASLKAHGLPLKPWSSPRHDPEIWRQYSEYFLNKIPKEKSA